MTTATLTATVKRWLTINEAATYIAGSDDTVRRWIKAGKLTPYRPNKKILLDADELDRFVRQHQEQPT